MSGDDDALLEPPWANADVRVTRLNVGDSEVAVVSFPFTEVAPDVELTPALRAVLRLVMAGKSNGEIASERGTSYRTVANQVRSLFIAFGVNSRGELVAKLARSLPRARAHE
jgi:DNA-binding CsgD family transcriptional regulator